MPIKLRIVCDMKPPTSLLLIFLSSHLLLLKSSGHPDIVCDTCQKIAAGDPNVNYAFCVEAFASVPASRRSDLNGLALIATRLTKTNATEAKTRIEAMLRSKAPMPPYVRSCLESCLEVYSDAVPALKDSARAIRAGRYGDACTYLSSVLDAPETCEDGFGDGGIESPLTEDNDRFAGLAVIALSVAALLQGH